MKLQQIRKYAEQIVTKIQPLCERIEIVGSIRRKRPEPRDIDLVVIPKPQTPSSFFPWLQIATQLKKELNMKIIRQGPSLMTLGFREVDLPVDIYRATEDTWGVLKLIRTGSTKHNIILCNRALALGMKLSAKTGVIKDDKVIASKTEEEIFKALDMIFVPVEQREVWNS